MRTKVSFLVKMSPDTITNKFMRCVDLFKEDEGIVIPRIMTVTWKNGERVGKKRIEQTKINLKKALEKTG
jgi:hypothetical protein